jgi:hypothetical protein
MLPEVQLVQYLKFSPFVPTFLIIGGRLSCLNDKTSHVEWTWKLCIRPISNFYQLNLFKNYLVGWMKLVWQHRYLIHRGGIVFVFVCVAYEAREGDEMWTLVTSCNVGREAGCKLRRIIKHFFFFFLGTTAHIGPWPPLMRFRNLTLIDNW